MPFTFYVISSTIASGIGIIFNGYILFVLLWHRSLQTANNVLLLHLAFVDSFYCVVILVSNSVVTSFTDSRICDTFGFIWTLLPMVVVWTVCGLSCDRYAAISSPLHYSRLVNSKKAVYFAAVSWFLGSVLALPPFIGICRYDYRDARLYCAASCRSGNILETSYVIIYTILSVILPLLIILISNLHILMIARYHRHRIVSAIYEVTLRAQATVTHQRNPCYLSKFKGRSAFLTILQLVGSLTVFTLPYFIVLVWEVLSCSLAEPNLVATVSILLTCMPPINAYVYGVKSRVLRQTLKILLQRHLYKQEATREVRRRLIVAPLNLSRRYSVPSNTQLDTLPMNARVVKSCEKKLERRLSLPESKMEIKVSTVNKVKLPTCTEEEQQKDNECL